MEYLRLRDTKLSQYLNQRVMLTFAAVNVQVKLQKDKITKFIQFQMMDCDVFEEARLFGATDAQIEMIKEGGVYEAAIDVKPYNGSTSCVVYNIQPGSLPVSTFCEWAPNVQWSAQIIQNALADIDGSNCGKIATKLILDNWQKFSSSPAGKSWHHSQLGGLLCHTAEVVETARTIAELFSEAYPNLELNRQLLLSAALIHDIGKIEEMNFNALGRAEYTIEGALQTHIYIGTAMVDSVATELGIGIQSYRINEANEYEPVKSDDVLDSEKSELLLLRHCILSHHGTKEWGSMVSPSIIEAAILHKADTTSAELNRIYSRLKGLEVGQMDTKWEGSEVRVVYKPDI